MRIKVWSWAIIGLMTIWPAGGRGNLPSGPDLPVAAQDTGVYTEDFTTYTAKDYTADAVWDPWSHGLRLARHDDVAQGSCAVAVDRNGNAVVVWRDYRNGNWDIYAQKIDASGSRLWATDVRVNVDSGIANQGNPAVAVDKSGNAIVVWDDGNRNSDIYAQKIDANGSRLWGTDVRVNSDIGTAYQGYPAVAVDGSGNAVVVWLDDRNDSGDIYAQKIDASGSWLWVADVRVNSDSGTNDQHNPAVVVDGGDNPIIVWQDDRNGNKDIYAQKLSSNGDRMWVTDVRTNSDTGMAWQEEPSIATDGNGNMAVVWLDYRTTNADIFIQRLGANGNKLWDVDIRVNSDTGTANQEAPTVAMDESGNAIVVWEDNRNSGDYDIYAQKVNTSGSRLWSADVRVNSDTGHTYQESPVLAVDGTGKAFIVWRDFRNNGADIYAQCWDRNGFRTWVTDIRINFDNGTVQQGGAHAAVDRDGSIIVIWTDQRNGNDDIYAQKIDASGNQLWAADVRVNSDTGSAYQWYPAVAVDGSGNVIVAWMDTRNDDTDIYAQALNTSGDKLWSMDMRVNSDMGVAGQGFPAVAMDGNGKAVVVWADTRSGHWDVYGQKIDAAGNRLWTADLRVNSDTGTAAQENPAVMVDGSGNVVVVWQDYRSGNYDVYAQRLSPSGTRLWAADIRVNSDARSAGQWFPTIAVTDEGNNAIIAWEEYLDGDYDIYAQKIDANGNRLWDADIRIDSNAGTSTQRSPAVAVDGSGNAVVVWRDHRNDNNGDIYAQKISIGGSQLWTTDVQVNSDAGTASQAAPAVAMAPNGNAIVVWQDYRNGNADLYAQRINTVGGKAWLADLQVVYPDAFYLPTGTAQSRIVDTLSGNLAAATLTADYALNGGAVQFYLTNDGGTTWAAITPGVTHVFTTTGSDLRWRAVLTGDPVWRHRTPVVNRLRIEYSTQVPYADAYEPDDTCAQARPIASDGVAQAHTFHQAADADWVWFEVVTNTTYIIQTSNPQANADTTLELRPACPQPPLATDDNTFGREAHITWRATFAGWVYVKAAHHSPTVYGADTGYDLSVRTYHPNGLAVVVAGHNDAWELQANIDHAADQAYLTLLKVGFAKADVRYLGPHPDRDVDGNGQHDDIVATATITNVRYAIQDWAREQGVALGVPFYVYLMDHGHYDLFLAEGNAGRVTAPLLDLWLSNLEATTGADQITVVIDACQSGSFIDVTAAGPGEISGPNRVVIASTTSQGYAYPSEQGALFSDVFWTALGDNQDVWSAYQAGKAAVAARGVRQTPWLDDNGDAVADAQDGALARSRGLAGVFGGSRPVMDWLVASAVSESGVATVTAQVRDDFGVVGVHVEVFSPGYVAPEAGPGQTPVLNVPTATLRLAGSELYTTTLTGLTRPGLYRVVGYAVDDEGNWASPVWTVMRSGKAVYLPLVIRNK